MRRLVLLSFLGCFLILWDGLGMLSGPAPAAQFEDSIPSAEVVNSLLEKEPFTLMSWPAWRKRLESWFGDRTHRTDAAFKGIADFMKGQETPEGNLAGDFAKDHLAWYFLGSHYLFLPGKGADLQASAAKAEKVLRESLRLENGFARAHRNLALALMLQVPPQDKTNPKLAEAARELASASQLDPSLPLAVYQAELAMRQDRFGEAEDLLQKAWNKDGPDPQVATMWAQAILSIKHYRGPRSSKLGELAKAFPQDGVLACFHSMGLAMDNQFRRAVEELNRARTLGVNPEQVLTPGLVWQIEREGSPGLLERVLWILLYFAIFYAAVMGLMTLAGLILASRTRGTGALQLLKTADEEVVAGGQVARAGGETMLARFYGMALVAGLVLFYLSIPFVIVGLLALTWALLLLIFQLGRIPIKLVIIVVLVGLGGAWAVFKSLFSRPASGAFGLPKSAADCPRLHQLIGDVAQRVNTEPIHEVYIAPGAAIGVHQEGRGPFGIFGVKKRVLTLGLSTMRYLTVPELKAILAHEYAHFSHSDTFYSRFIYQVHLSIDQALYGMATSGGMLNYVNPFFWFLYLYYKCYSLLSAGFSRSREFLADRMACTLYGSEVFASGLLKVSTDGTLFEKTINDNIAHLLNEQKAFINMYEAFQQFRNEQLTKEERDKFYEEIMGERGSLFASHPTIAERLEAAAVLPKAPVQDNAPALGLFDNPEEMERELTQFLTDYIAYLQHLQAAAAEAQ